MYQQTGTLVKNKFKEHLIPTVLTTLALSLATVVDSIIVGNLIDSKALAAIGLSTPIIYFINVVYVLFGVGGMMCASVAKGRWEMEKANRLFTVAIVGGTTIMTVFLVVMLLLLQPVSLALAGGDKALATLTRQYIAGLLPTGPALILSNGVALFMRADGKPKQSAMIVMIANGVNLILDYVLIRFCHAGIMGAGLSTSLGYVVGVFVVLPYFISKKSGRSFRFTKPIGWIATVKEVVKTGLPKGCTYIAALGRTLVLNAIVVATFSTGGMTVMTVLMNVLNFAAVVVSGTGDTLLPIVGTLYGERDVYGIKKTVESARNILAVAIVGIVVVFCTCSQPIGWLWGVTAQSELDLLQIALYMFAAYIPFYALVTTMQNFYNITGRETLAVTMAILDGFVFVCLFAVVLPLIHPNCLWLCYGLGSGCTFITVLVIGYIIRKRETVQGLLLLKPEPDGVEQWSMTIDSTPTQAVGLAKQVVAFCLAHDVDETMANRLGMGIEEMAMATAQFAHGEQSGSIDIMVKRYPDHVRIRFRDNGRLFNPLEYQTPSTDGFVTDGIALLKANADDISYSNQLGFNITVLTFQI